MLSFEAVGNIINKYIGKRQLVLLGDNKNLRTLLAEKYKIEPIYIATSVKDNLSKGDNYRMLSDFAGKSNEYYICIPFLEYDDKLVARLKSYSYEEFNDFVFARHKRVVLPPYTENYTDEYGNSVVSNGGFTTILTPVTGNNIVNVSKNVTAGANSIITMAGVGGDINISENCKFSLNSKIDLFSYAKVMIGRGADFSFNFRCRAVTGSTITIGRDCMFSNDIEVYAGDGHAIFDTETGKRLNMCMSGRDKINIGNHVWVGLRSVILSSSIGTSSIIGAGSIVKGNIPEKCIAVGNPAVVKKHNILWSKNNSASDIREWIVSSDL